MRRVHVLAILGCAGFVLLVARLAFLQFFRSADLRAAAAMRDCVVRMLPAPRCKITTTKGEPLAEDRHVIDLVITAGSLYPDRAASMLVIDQLERSGRRAALLKDFADWSLPHGLNSQALLDRWSQGRGTEYVRLAADLTAAQSERLRPYAQALIPTGGEESAAFFRLGTPLGGLTVPRELWLDVTSLGITLGATPAWDDLRRAITRNIARMNGGASFLRELEESLGGHPDRDEFPAIDYEGRRAYAARKEVEVIPPVIPEDEGRRISRHIALRRPYFRGLELRPQDEGGIFAVRRTYRVVYTRDRVDVYSRLLTLVGREGYGSSALSAEFRRNTLQILARMQAISRQADTLARRKFEEKSSERPPDIAFELAEVWRARYLEHALFAREQLLIADIGSFGDAAVQLIELLPSSVPVALRSRYVRRYPQGEVVGSLVGLARPWELTIEADSPEGLASFQQEISAHREFLQALRAKADIAATFSERRRDTPRLRTPDDVVGIQGLERALDARLRGLVGLHAFTAAQRVQIPPLPGTDAEIVIDVAFTRALYDVLRDATRGLHHGYACRSGFAAVMDLENGNLLCLASYPSFDPEKYLAGDPRYIERLDARAQDAPLHNHCFFPTIPGSVFKLFVAAAYLEEGGAPGTTAYCRGEEDHCESAHGAVNLHEAIRSSCNHYFVELGTKRLRREKLVHWLDQLGFSGTPRFLTPELCRIAAPDYRTTLTELRYYMCYGSGEIRVLPLVMLRLVAAIARGGSAPRPRLLHDEPVRIDPAVLRPSTCATLRRAMRAVVAEPSGTAHGPDCGLSVFNVAAKTGTAELSSVKKDNNAWMVAFAPFDAPKYAFVVCLEHVEHRGHGGETAGPVLAAALEYLEKGAARGLRAAIKP